MSEARAQQYAEYLRVPCGMEFSRQQGVTHELRSVAMVLTVEYLYPGQLDNYIQEAGPPTALLTTRFIHQKYTDAVLDFGFAQARGLEIGLLARSVEHCSQKAATCPTCPLNSLYEDFNAQLEDLRTLARQRGIGDEEFQHIFELSVAPTAPEARQVATYVDTMLEHLTSER